MRHRSTGSLVEETSHRRTFIYKEPDEALRFGQPQSALQNHLGRSHAARRLVSERLQHQDLDNAAFSAARFRRWEQASQQPERLADGTYPVFTPVLGDERPGQCHLLELAQVAGCIVNGQAAFPAPLQSFGQSALRNPNPGLQGRNWTDVRERASDKKTLSLVKQAKRGLQLSLGLLNARLSDAPAMVPIRKSSVLAQLRRRRLMLLS